MMSRTSKLATCSGKVAAPEPSHGRDLEATALVTADELPPTKGVTTCGICSIVPARSSQAGVDRTALLPHARGVTRYLVQAS